MTAATPPQRRTAGAPSRRRQPAGWGRVVLATLLLLSLPTSAAGTAEKATRPLLAGDPAIDRSLAFLEDLLADRDCSFRAEDGHCSMNVAAWTALAVSAAGVDPGQWPDPGHSALGWMLAHPDEYDSASTGAAMSYALSIIALEASGVGARAVPLPSGGTRDLVADLLAEHNGANFGTGLNANEWALFALNAVGYRGPEVNTTVLGVVATQHPDGGLSFGTNPDSEVEMTAWAIVAVAPHGRQGFVDKAVGFLRSSQLRSGPMRACWPGESGDYNIESTAAAVQALAYLRQDPLEWSVDGQSPLDCILALQRGDGGFASTLQSTKSDAFSQHQCILGLAWAPYGTSHGPTRRETLTPTVPFGSHPSPASLGLTTGFLRGDDGADAVRQVDAATRGNTTYRGVSWAPVPHPVDVVLQVPFVPAAAPAIEAPASAPHNSTVAVRVAPADWWARSVILRLPDGSLLAAAASRGVPAEFQVRLDAAGPATVTAWARNEFFEEGPAATLTIQATNAPPEATLEAPAQAPRSVAAMLRAGATDPEGDPIAFTWTVNGTVVGEGPTLRLPPAAPGPMVVALTARDPWGGMGTRQATLRWVDGAPVLHGISPASAAPGMVRLILRTGDPDGDPVTVRWLEGGTLLATGPVADVVLGAGLHNLTVEAVTAYATTRVTHRLNVQPGALAVALGWDRDRLQVEAPGRLLRVGSTEGPSPLSLADAVPGQALDVFAIEQGEVAAAAHVIVPPRPTPPQVQQQEAPDHPNGVPATAGASAASGQDVSGVQAQSLATQLRAEAATDGSQEQSYARPASALPTVLFLAMALLVAWRRRGGRGAPLAATPTVL